MTATKLHNGAWQISTIHNGFLVTRTYYGFTKKESIKHFRTDLKKL